MARLVPPKSGFTKTPNRMLDESARAGARLPARHRSVVEFFVREMLGWHADALAVSQRAIAERLGVSASTIGAAVADLERWRVIRRRGSGRGRIAVFELLEPAGWRISRTAGAIRTAERRRRARGGDQLLLPFPDVAGVVDLPSQIRDRTRDRTRDVPRSLVAALIEKRKKSKGVGIPERRDTVPLALSGRGDRMPNDEPQRPTALELRQIRRLRAARARVRRLDPSRAFDQKLLDWTASSLTEAEVEEEIARREAELAAEETQRRARAQVEAMRHEGKR